MKLIVAVDQNWGIGRNGGLLTHLPEDMKFFRTTTKNKVVVMGRKTLESFPGGLPLRDRTNILLTRQMEGIPDGLIVCHSVDEVLKETKAYDPDGVFIIGGQSIYEQFLPYCDTAYVTFMKAEFQPQPDTWFPSLDEKEEWDLVTRSEEHQYNTLCFEFRTYRKI